MASAWLRHATCIATTTWRHSLVRRMSFVVILLQPACHCMTATAAAYFPMSTPKFGFCCRYVRNRSVIVTTVRCFLLVFLTLLVPAIVEGSTEQPTCSSWVDLSGMWPLAAISMGLLVRPAGMAELERFSIP